MVNRLDSRISDAIKALQDLLDSVLPEPGARDYIPIPVEKDKRKKPL